MSNVRISRFHLVSAVALCLALGAGSVAAEPRWYVTGRAGQASVEEAFGPRFGGWSVDDEDTTAGLEVGYLLHRHLALQAGYRDLGTYPGGPRPCAGCPLPLVQPFTLLVPFHPREVDFTGFSLSAVPRWPLGEHASLFARLGAIDWRGDVTPLFPGQPVEDPSDLDFVGGLGAEYVFGSGLGVLLELETSDLADAVTLGAAWHF